MALYAGGAIGTLIKLVCPHCGEVQARARKLPKKEYACRRCHRRFTADQAAPKAKKR
jgi:DNA-directed RNA polymerase subunit RPC12/RpoP